jgi:hypothetical protein
LAFARHRFEISHRHEDGSTVLDHLLLVWEKTGHMPAKLRDAPVLPEGLTSLWRAFNELHESRGAAFGFQRITFVDMEAWQRMTGAALEPWEVELIRKADNLWLAEFAPKPKETT